jgi:lytic murein transglycosylase
MAATRHEPEYGKPIGAYVGSIVSAGNIAAGLRKASEWAATFDAVEKTYGVDRWIILAIWGIESSYGTEKDHWDVFRSLATLAEARYRDPLFRNELLVALGILQREHLPRDMMLSSWAGAMGQPQFMPSSFIKYAVDFSGDGRRDIWTNVPDVLASTANYFQKAGWTPNLPWGFEVVVPQGFDYRRSRGSFPDWGKLGVRRADGEALPQTGDAIMFFPSGAAGPAFLVTTNFVVIKQYNNSDAYALAVAHLADRMRGWGPIRTAWPSDDRQLSRAARIALQHKLADQGYEVHDFEGRIDFDLRDAIREMQIKYSMLPDGHPTATLLDRLGVKVP